MQNNNEAVTLVIFGASGDLTERKLIPSLYNLYKKGRLPAHFNIIGNSRTEYTHDEFRDKLKEIAQEKDFFSADDFDEFAQRLWYIPGNVKSDDFYAELDEFMTEKENGTSNRLYYLSTAPFLYEPILEHLASSGLNQEKDGWRRVVIEKPFGYDEDSASKLNQTVHDTFREEQVYRIDHYLGKETAQNMLFFRFANTVFEPIWNRNYIDHVQITVSESVDVGRRAGYYDTSGVIRDMFQNHLLQLMALVAMEPPLSFEATALRDEKLKLLRAVHPVNLQDTVRAQYDGYCGLEGVEDNSQTPTFAALKLGVGNWRWQGVPFYLRSGKALATKTSEITIQFKNPPHMMFRQTQGMQPNRLIIHIQPHESIEMEILAKMPDTAQAMKTVHMDFSYEGEFNGADIPDAYERLLLDAIQGDAALFSRSDSIEAQWNIVDQIIHGWENSDDAPALVSYQPGSWGPQAADDLLSRSGHQWLIHDH